MKKIYQADQHKIYELLVEGERIAVFKKDDYSELFNIESELLKLEMGNNSVNGMTKCQLTFGNKVEFTFSMYTGDSPINYLKNGHLIQPQIILRQIWPKINN